LNKKRYPKRNTTFPKPKKLPVLPRPLYLKKDFNFIQEKYDFVLINYEPIYDFSRIKKTLKTGYFRNSLTEK